MFRIIDTDSAESQGKLTQVAGKIKELKSFIKNYVDNIAAIVECFSTLMDCEEDCNRLFYTLSKDTAHVGNNRTNTNPNTIIIRDGRMGLGYDEICECLEPYLRHFISLHTRLINMQTGLAGMEESLALRLDVNETKLLLGETYTSIIDTSLAFGCYVTAIFGMNLDQIYSYERVYGLFLGVTVGTTALILVGGSFIALYYYRRTK